MLYVIREDGQHVPSPYCDFCEDRIERAAEGNYVWNPQADGPPEMLFTHKYCHRAFQKSNHTVGWYSTGLSLLPVYMTNAWDVDEERAQDRAELFARL